MCKKKKQSFESKELQNLYISRNEEFWNILKQCKVKLANRVPVYQILSVLNDLDTH